MSAPTVLISGALANKPFNGGNAWSRLSWVLGFRRLGFDVCFVEQIGQSSCVAETGAPADFQASANLAYFRAIMERFGLGHSSALICGEGEQVHGLPLAELTTRARQANLLFNLSGHLTHPDIKERAPCKVYYDDDPGFTQFWHAAAGSQERSAGILPAARTPAEEAGSSSDTRTGSGPLRPGVPRSNAGDGARLEGHDFYFTIGANIGAPECVIPTGGITWRHTRPPVVLEEWPDTGSLHGSSAVPGDHEPWSGDFPVAASCAVGRQECRPSERRSVGSADSDELAKEDRLLTPALSSVEEEREEAFDRFTTVASWRGAYGPVQYGGKTYGLKVHEFRKFFELPQRSGRTFEIALHIHPGDQKDREALQAHGWRIVDPKQVAGTPDAFRRYVQGSGAEFSVAQGVYVDTNSGWFSDRTVRYLASGKPALVQETGFSRHLPVGAGLLAFRTMEEAVDGAERIVRDYEHHCRAARRVAEEHFDSDKVIRQLTKEIGLKLP